MTEHSKDGRLSILATRNAPGFIVTDTVDGHVEVYSTSRRECERFVAGYDYSTAIVDKVVRDPDAWAAVAKAGRS